MFLLGLAQSDKYLLQVTGQRTVKVHCFPSALTEQPSVGAQQALFVCSPLPQTLQKEIQGHQPRIDDIFERSQNIVTDSSSLNAEAIRRRLADLKELWGLLIEETEKRHRRLEEAHRAQQYYFDAAEAEAWMSEQELYMMSEEKAKVREVSSPAPGNLRLGLGGAFLFSAGSCVFVKHLIIAFECHRGHCAA